MLASAAVLSPRIAAIAVVAFAVLASTCALAGLRQPDWRTIDTAHFQIHYPVGLEAVAFRAARLCEDAHAGLTPILQHVPKQRTQVVISDFGDSANGSATALPGLKMNLLAAPPEIDGNLGDYDDWLRVLIDHEYTHILHLDTVSGWPDHLNDLMGKRFAPNQNLPSFLLEGTAVWLESRRSGRGRIYNAMFRGWLRLAALSDTLHGLDVVTHAPRSFPGPNVWYMYGGHFIDYLSRAHDPLKLASLFAAMGDDLVPFGVQRATESVYGQTLTALFQAWQQALREQAKRERLAVMSEGPMTPLVELTTLGRSHQNPRWLPDGSLLSIESDGFSTGAIYRREPKDGFTTRQVYLTITSTDHFDVCADTGHLIFDQLETHEGMMSVYDLYLWDGLRKRRLTRGARLREPACLPGGVGGAGVVAAQLIEGRTRLVQVDFDGVTEQSRITVLDDPGGLGQVAFPVPSPDGRSVVYLRVVEGRRDLVSLDRRTGARRILTDDAALELHPHFSAAGDEVLYASDRTGVFELYALPLDTLAPRRLTRVLGGLLDVAPSRDGRLLIAQSLSVNGTNLVRLEGVLRNELTMTAGPTATSSGTQPRKASTDAPLPTRTYGPGETLWPLAWAPKFTFSSAQDTQEQLGITVEATDALSHHVLLGELVTLPEAQAYGLSMAYAYRRFVPTLSLSLSRSTRTRPEVMDVLAPTVDARDDVSQLAAGISLPFSGEGHAANVSMRYVVTRIEPLSAPAREFSPTDDPPPVREVSRQPDLLLGFRWSNADRNEQSITGERGRSFGLSLRLRDRALGGEQESAEVYWDVTQYAGLWARHGLALRTSGALASDSPTRRVRYGLSPAPERNTLLDALDQIAFGSGFLRGFVPNTVTGSAYLLSTLEYRMPLLAIDHGFGTVPFFLRDAHLAFFSDWATGTDGALELWPGQFSKSVGAELAMHAILGWRLPLDTRLGFAHGFGDGGEDQVYFFTGSWF